MEDEEEEEVEEVKEKEETDNQRSGQKHLFTHLSYTHLSTNIFLSLPHTSPSHKHLFLTCVQLPGDRGALRTGGKVRLHAPGGHESRSVGEGCGLGCCHRLDAGHLQHRYEG